MFEHGERSGARPSPPSVGGSPVERHLEELLALPSATAAARRPALATQALQPSTVIEWAGADDGRGEGTPAPDRDGSSAPPAPWRGRPVHDEVLSTPASTDADPGAGAPEGGASNTCASARPDLDAHASSAGDPGTPAPAAPGQGTDPGADPPDDDDDDWLERAVPDLGGVGSLDRVTGLASLVARVQGLQLEALSAFAGGHAPTEPVPVRGSGGAMVVLAAGAPDDRVVDELAPALCLGRVATRRRVAEADQVLRCLPVTHGLLCTGVIDLDVARVVVRETAALSEADARTVDSALAAELVGSTPGRARRRVAAVVAQVDPAGVRQRAVAATRLRRVVFAPLPDGMASLTAIGPAPAVRSFYETLTSAALDRTTPSREHDPVTDLADADGAPHVPGLDARRFDRLGQLLDQPLDGSRGGCGAKVEVLVGIATLLGVDEDPAELSGYGPLPAVVARCWGQHGRLRRFFTDPRSGLVIGVDGHTYAPGTIPDPDAPTPLGPEEAGGGTGGGSGGGGGGSGSGGGGGAGGGSAGSGGGGGNRGSGGAGRGDGGAAPSPALAGSGSGSALLCPVARRGGGAYAPGASLARLVRVHRPRCAAPGCSVPAGRCDLDHRVPWPVGATCTCQLAPLCRTHHLMKHRRGWLLARADPDAGASALQWTSPLGQVHEVSPDPPLRRALSSRRAARALRATAGRRRSAPRPTGEAPPETDVPPPF